MKILITYYSNTGNTKKVAESLKEGLTNEDVKLKPINEVNPSNLNNYDLIFLGSGIYASRVNKALVDLVGSATDLPQNFVFFCTHASLENYQDGFKLVKRKIGETSKILAEFDCCGDNIGIPEATRKLMLKRLPLEKRKTAERHQQWLKGRPNEEDLEKARAFARTILKNF